MSPSDRLVWAVAAPPIETNMTRLALMLPPLAAVALSKAPNVDLVIKKDDNQTVATPGQAITYLIRVINKSNIAVDSIKVSDIIPADLTNVQLYATSGDYGSVTGLWTNIFLAPNGDELNPNNTPNSFVTLILEGIVIDQPIIYWH
jgi:uncharacterized repeat protein (TIGR01451 family)